MSVCVRALYMYEFVLASVCFCLCLDVSIYFCIFVCTAYDSLQFKRVDNNYRHLYLSYLILWSEKSNGLMAYTRTHAHHTHCEQCRTKERITKTGCDISWVQMVIIHDEERERESNIQLRYKHTHSHTLTCSHLFIYSFCSTVIAFLLNTKTKWRKKTANAPGPSPKKTRMKKGKQNDTMLFDYYLANWNNKAQNEHQMHKHTGV